MSHPSRPLRVLVVDDNDDAAFMTCTLLGLLGYDSEPAYSGAAALEAASICRPDVIFLDLSMPGMSGLEVAQALRTTYGHSLRIIALSALASPSIRKSTHDAGFDAHLQKPATIDEIVAEIALHYDAVEQENAA